MIDPSSIPNDPDWPTRIRDQAASNARRHQSCTQSILAAFMDELGVDDPLVMRSAGAMHGGMLSSMTCGVVTAGMMVLGLVAGRERLSDGVDGLFPIVGPAQDLVRRLTTRLGSASCFELTGVDFTDLGQAMRFMASDEEQRCNTFVADGAEEIARFLQEAVADGRVFRAARRSDPTGPVLSAAP